MVKCDFITCKDKQQFPMKKIRKMKSFKLFLRKEFETVFERI